MARQVLLNSRTVLWAKVGDCCTDDQPHLFTKPCVVEQLFLDRLSCVQALADVDAQVVEPFWTLGLG